MRLLMNFTRAYPWRSTVMAACLVLSGVFEGLGLSVLLPLLTLAFPQGDGGGDGLFVSKNTKLQKVVSNAFNSLGLSPSIEHMLLIVLICILLKSVISLAAKKEVGYTVARVGTDLRKAIVRSLLCARWEQYIKRPLGEIANAMAFEADQSSKAYHCGILMVAEFIQFIVYSVTASLISWKATFLALLVGISTIFALHCFIRRARWAGVQQTDVSKSLLSLMTDIILSIKPLKAMAREDLADFMFDKNLQDLNTAQEKRVFNKEMLKAFQEPLLFIFLGFGIYMTLVVWRIPISQMMMLVFLIANLLKQLSKVQERYQETVTYESAYWSIQELINSIEQSRETSVEKLVLPKLTKGVNFKDVSFRYGEGIVLNKLSMHIGSGKITIIVGPSGAGKSTIMDLVTGLVQPREGEVLIDDLPLSSLDLRSWRRMIGYVPQETILLHDTIYNNISLGNSKLNESHIIASLEKAGAWDFVQELPGMLNYVVGERGGGLSGGQRQRISIARALVNQPEILLLDEATSALDPVSEIAICDTLIKLRGKLTIMMISHQPALLKIADHAYLIKDFSAESIQPNMLLSHPLAAMNTIVT